MCIAILLWLLLAYFLSTKPGWFGCLFVFLVVSVLIAGCG